MDLKRVKVVLIVLFAALNIFLFILIFNSTAAGTVDRQVLKNARAALVSNGVDLRCAIPSYNADTGIPEYADTLYDDNAISLLIRQSAENGFITFNSDNSVVLYNMHDEKISKITDQKELDQYIRNLLARFKLNMTGFVLDSSATYENGKRNLTYILKLSENLYAYDCTAEIVISDTGIEYLKMKHRELVGTFDASPIIPAYQILMMNYNIRGTVINRIDFGFMAYRLVGEALNPSYTPAWRIISADGADVRYYKAYTGDEINIF
jgi:hypothetical protein